MTSLTQQIFTTGHTAVITGASSGIGRAASLMCASRGMNVYMIDIDSDELTSAVDHVKNNKQQSDSNSDCHIEGIIADVSSLPALQNLLQKIKSNNHPIHFLMNNAGTGLGGGALSSPSTLRRVIDVNTYGPINGCVTFIPYMKETADIGLIVNTGSKQGITMPPGNLAYNVSKAALKCYAEGLEHELRTEREEGGKLHSALLVPGWVNTSIYLKTVRDTCRAEGKTFDEDGVFFHEEKPAEGAWMPRQVVEFMLEELDEGRFYIICPDNDVDRETDNLRMEWTMGDIIENRPPLSRWHKDYKEKFSKFLEDNKKKG